LIKENNYVPLENNKFQLENNNLELANNLVQTENPYINQYSSSIRIINNDIYFYGPITSGSCKELNDVILILDNESKKFGINFNTNPPPINLHIQSEGGSLMDTFYTIDLIDNLKTPVNTYVDGYVASAGSLISVVGKKRFMTANSFIMIHQLSSSVGEGKFNDLDDNMDNLNKFMETIRNLYLKKTKIPKEKLNDILDHDLWMNSKECLEYGLVDEIL
jgi:ATP-dependent protease ClpP protease subunit